MYEFGPEPGRRAASFVTTSPARSHETVGNYGAFGPADVPGMMAAARAAQRDWASLPGTVRLARVADWVAALAGRTDEIARAVTAEQGKPLAEARGETAKSLDEARQMLAIAAQPCGMVHVSARAGVRPISMRRPRGVIVAITPWNFPVLTPMRKLVPALAFGNAILLKPSELAPAAACILAEVARDILPEGLLQVLPGGGDFGAALVAGGAEGVTFTGSVPTGRAVYRAAADTLAELSLELGGKNAAVIHDAPDLDRCLDQIAAAAFLCSGQRCTAISRVIVRRELEGAVTDGLVARAEALVPGCGFDQGVTLGPLISAAHLDRVGGLVGAGLSAGARLCTGGARLADGALAQGHFFGPTILDRMGPENPAAREEIFGPVISVLGYDTLDQAFALLNDTEFGLTSALFSADAGVIDRFMGESAAGMLHINHGTTPDSNMPFLGIRNSGVGACSVGPGAAAFYTTEHAIYLGRA